MSRLLVAIYLIFALVGCADSLPECADPKLIEEVKKISEDLHKERIVSNMENEAKFRATKYHLSNEFIKGMSEGLRVNFNELRAKLLMPDPSLIKVHVTNMRFIQLISYDKEVLRRTCAATLYMDVEMPKSKLPNTGGVALALQLYGSNELTNHNYDGSYEILYSVFPDQQDKRNNIINVKFQR